MPIAQAVALLLQYGLPLTQQIVMWYQSGKTVVTPEDMAELVKLASYSSSDSLAKFGIKIVDGKVVPATP